MKMCGQQCEVYSRVTGYFRPVKNWNIGKQEEFRDRVTYAVATGERVPAEPPARAGASRKGADACACT
ncbi:MAG: anaerobic ribonucleoside triphosphate reductase [Planctomycetes bacterium ADurb.Bin069]|jgi:hypothetical protein|nr:MAG: anaerobic ribonucleoside triphosphate reductase [Planctomycetes bacterium ADurb.Bin069]